MNSSRHHPVFLYTYACHEDEISLCNLELRSLFAADTPPHILLSHIRIDPSRSPFIKERIEVIYEGGSLSDITEQVAGLQLSGATFKVIFVKRSDMDSPGRADYAEQRAIEREVGSHMNGKADVRHPDRQFGIASLGGRWYFGHYERSRYVWLHHMKKPRSYSIALPTRAARAIVNIAVPHPPGIRAIDPCCGIGTVLVEALSMGIDIVGRDINPLVVRGARENIAHFGLTGRVELGSIADITGSYDSAIVDMPYNLVSKVTPEEQLFILRHARRIAGKAVLVSTQPMDGMIANAGFIIADRCVARKGSFARYITVCN
ncbi:RNA methyltransferase [Paenibacillus mesophilus]|uniref:TRM11 family SAM-dependent methyltransferase n=1 Tax=Paenibacillus mesophilus TaxID=2582849 RepID=UPI00110DA1ED|nr:RNA methyltransferase [Paenibacillus mesophilus]TMV48044.1 RNA methyltransferase [Paenibacillus mesophilus]